MRMEMGRVLNRVRGSAVILVRGSLGVRMLGAIQERTSPPVLSGAAWGRIWGWWILWGSGRKNEGRCRGVLEESRARRWVGGDHGEGRRRGEVGIKVEWLSLGLGSLVST